MVKLLRLVGALGALSAAATVTEKRTPCRLPPPLHQGNFSPLLRIASYYIDPSTDRTADRDNHSTCGPVSGRPCSNHRRLSSGAGRNSCNCYGSGDSGHRPFLLAERSADGRLRRR